MLTCKEFEARISALIDDELTGRERIETLEHLDGCLECRACWEDFLAIRDAIGAQEQDVPAGFAEAVMARVRETKQENMPERKVLRFPQWKRFAALAACCAVVLLGIWSMDLMPGAENSMDMAALNNCAAPERAAQGDTITGSVQDGGMNGPAQEMPGADYGVSEDDCAAPCDVPEIPDALPQSEAKSDDANTFAQNSDFTAAVITRSDVAEEWVEDNLHKEWVSGARYALSEEQYNELREFLESAGEEFTEITGNQDGRDYLLLAE